MGCSCSGTEGINVSTHHPNLSSSSQLNPIQNQPNHRQSYFERQIHLRQSNQSFPHYEPYLQARNNPNFNMKETDDFVGEGIRKMRGFICDIEKEDLFKKRNDFWSSRFEGNVDTWELIHNFCIGDFSNNDLLELLSGCGLNMYSGCINVLYDNKGNLYEIPNYCIHDPVLWDNPKQKIIKPKEERILLKVKHVDKEIDMNVSNFSTGYDLKEEIVERRLNRNGKKYLISQVRLFYRGKEVKDKDFVYQHMITDGSYIMMSLKEE